MEIKSSSKAAVPVFAPLGVVFCSPDPQQRGRLHADKASVSFLTLLTLGPPRTLNGAEARTVTSVVSGVGDAGG